MSDPNNLIYQFSQQAHPGRLTALGQGINQLVTQKRAEKAEAARLSEYNNLLSQFNDTQDPSLIPQLQNVYPEKFEGFQKSFDMMDEVQRKNTVQENMATLGHLYTGNNEKAAETLALRARAYRAEGEDADAKTFEDLSREVLSGNPDNVKTFLGMLTGTIPEGAEALTNFRSMNQERRDEMQSITDFVESGSGLEYLDDAHKNRVLTEANKMSDPILARMFAEMGAIVGGGDGASGMTGTQVADFTYKLNNEYNDRTEDYRTVTDSANSIYAAAKPDSGFSDDAILKLFNKVLDPDSVVRQSELEATLAAQGKLEEFKNILPKFGTGVQLNADTRPKLIEIVRILDEEAQKNIQTVQDKMNPIVDKYVASNEETRDADRSLVYGVSKTAQDSAAQGREESTGRLANLRAFVRGRNPNSTGNIEAMTEEQIKSAYPGTYPAFNEQEETTVIPKTGVYGGQ